MADTTEEKTALQSTTDAGAPAAKSDLPPSTAPRAATKVLSKARADEAKAALLKSISDFVPREMTRTVSINVAQLRATFGEECESKLGVPADMPPSKLAEVTVGALYELTKDHALT